MRADSFKLKQSPTFFFTAMNTHICLINQFIALCSCSVETVGKSIKNQPFWIVEILLKEYSQFDSRCLCYSFAVSCNMYENTHQRIPPMNGFLVEVIIYGCSMGSLLLGIQVLLCVLGTFFSFSRTSRTEILQTVACASSKRQNDRINFGIILDHHAGTFKSGYARSCRFLRLCLESSQMTTNAAQVQNITGFLLYFVTKLFLCDLIFTTLP